jgi:predicted MFS family arabinose efflux permease
VTRAVTFLFAVATGLCAANLYYAQPLLERLSEEFTVGSGTASAVVTVSQVGFALTLLLVVPLGDAIDRWRLVVGLTATTAAAAVVIATAPDVRVVIGAAALLGAGAAAAQVLVGVAAAAAAPERRGAVVGTVMTGLLVGILLARTVSGAVADLAGWRAVFWLAAVVQVGLVVVALRQAARSTTVPVGLRYGELLRGMVRLVAASPRLRATMLLGALNFAAFSIMWTTLAFHLSDPPFGYGEAVIGLFGLLGVVGALAAAPAGRAADRGARGRVVVLLTLGTAGSFAVLGLGSGLVVALALGVVLLDVAVQGVHVSNQTVVFALPDALHSRANAAYMSSYFLGGAAGSLAAGMLHEAQGWGAVCVLGAAVGVTCLLLGALRERVPVGPV